MYRLKNFWWLQIVLVMMVVHYLVYQNREPVVEVLAPCRVRGTSGSVGTAILSCLGRYSYNPYMENSNDDGCRTQTELVSLGYSTKNFGVLIWNQTSPSTVTWLKGEPSYCICGENAESIDEVCQLKPDPVYESPLYVTTYIYYILAMMVTYLANCQVKRTREKRGKSKTPNLVTIDRINPANSTDSTDQLKKIKIEYPYTVGDDGVDPESKRPMSPRRAIQKEMFVSNPSPVSKTESKDSGEGYILAKIGWVLLFLITLCFNLAWLVDIVNIV